MKTTLMLLSVLMCAKMSYAALPAKGTVINCKVADLIERAGQIDTIYTVIVADCKDGVKPEIIAAPVKALAKLQQLKQQHKSADLTVTNVGYGAVMAIDGQDVGPLQPNQEALNARKIGAQVQVEEGTPMAKSISAMLDHMGVAKEAYLSVSKDKTKSIESFNRNVRYFGRDDASFRLILADQGAYYFRNDLSSGASFIFVDAMLGVGENSKTDIYTLTAKDTAGLYAFLKMDQSEEINIKLSSAVLACSSGECKVSPLK